MKWLLIILALSCEARDLRWEYAKRGQGVTSGLVGWYKANGNALDSSVYGNNGTAYNVGYTNGQNGTQAFLFENSNAYIDCGNSPALSNISATLTVAYWWQNTGTNGVSYAQLVSKGYGAIAGGSWSASRSAGSIGSGYFFARYASNSAYNYPGNWPSISLGQWRHHAHVIDAPAGKWRTYINGALALESDNTNSLYRGSASLKIGGSSDPGEPRAWFNGVLDDIRIYNRALTPAEISRIYRSPK